MNTPGSRLIPPRILRTLALIAGLAGLVLPVLAVRWITDSATETTIDEGELRPKMVIIPAGTYTIGSPETEPERSSDETQREVQLSRFAISETEVTQAQYECVMGSNPARDDCGPACPVNRVFWRDAVEYMITLSERDPTVTRPCYTKRGDEVVWVETACDGYRLPTEAEWEAAARAGSSDRYAGTDEPSDVCAYGNVVDAAFLQENSDWQFGSFECDDGYPGLAPVRRFKPNAFYLYDMTGNVYEWTWGWYDKSSGALTDLRGTGSGSLRVFRGGSFGGNPRNARVAGRFDYEPSYRNAYVGFRVARSLH